MLAAVWDLLTNGMNPIESIEKQNGILNAEIAWAAVSLVGFVSWFAHNAMSKPCHDEVHDGRVCHTTDD